MSEPVTVGQWIAAMEQWSVQKEDCLWISKAFLQTGRTHGWLEGQDVTDLESLIERRQAARILHNYLRLEKKEPELDDPEKIARVLLDLYDCRACVNHVAQMYAKGIMQGITEHIFGMKEAVLMEELEPTMERAFSLECRILRS